MGIIIENIPLRDCGGQSSLEILIIDIPAILLPLALLSITEGDYVKGNYRRALMIVMVFLISMLSPLTIDNEPVDAHVDHDKNENPVLVSLYINKIISETDEYDDLRSPVDLWNNDFLDDLEAAEINIDWTMDHNLHTNPPVTGEEAIHLWQMEGAGPYEYDMGHKRIYAHYECSPRTTITFDFSAVDDDTGDILRPAQGVVGELVAVVGVILTTQSAGVGAFFGSAGMAYGGMETLKDAVEREGWLIPIGSGSVTFPAGEGNQDSQTKTVWTLPHEGRIGVELELVVTEMEDMGSCSDVAGWGDPGIESSTDDKEGNGVASSDPNYDSMKSDIADSFDNIRTAFSDISNWTGPEAVGMNNSNQTYNQSGNSNQTYNQSGNSNHSNVSSVDREQLKEDLLSNLSNNIEEIAQQFVALATFVNPNNVSQAQGAMYYAHSHAEYGQYDQALNEYELAILSSLDAIETREYELYGETPVVIEATGDLPDNLVIEIFSGDCENDCGELNRVYIGNEGNSSVETELDGGNYTVVMSSDGEIYSSNTLEVLSGGELTVLKISGGSVDSSVLNLAFYIQGLIVAALPALVGFAGSKQYLEGKTNTQESKKLEPSTTPLWIGVILFLAIFFMMVG